MEEMLVYCMDEVNVLSHAFFFKSVKMDPFRQAITKICNKLFRTMFLKPYSVGIITKGGYRMGDRQSFKALQCLT